MYNRANWRSILCCVLAAEGAWFLSWMPFCAGSRSLYMFYRPAGMLPGWAFMLVLFLLHATLGLAACAALNSRGLAMLLPYIPRAGLRAGGVAGRKTALLLYMALLGASFLWNVFFFGFHWFLFALIWSFLIIALIFITMKRFAAINSLAGLLLAPFLAWHLYAAYICFGFWTLNAWVSL